MTAPQSGRSYPPVAPRPALYSASNLLERTSTSSGFQGVYPPFQPMRSDSASKQEQTKTRRISQSRRQRTAMSCDRCKVRKIKCLNPDPGPCDYCTRMRFPCQITAQRKHRPLYFTSDEQFQLMIAILQHFVPHINLDLEGLKAVGAELGIQNPAPSGAAPQMPLRNLPASLAETYLQRTGSTSNQSEGMSERSLSWSREIDKGEVDDSAAASGADSSQTPDPMSPTYSPSSQFSPQIPFQLPSRPVADACVERYFSDVNEFVFVLPYNEFHNWHSKIYDDNLELMDPTKQVIVFTVFAFGSKVQHPSYAEHFFSRARRAAGSILSTASLETIQALMLLSLYSMHDSTESGTWTYAGAAIRVAQTLNLLQDNEIVSTIGDREMRRRVWWSLYDLERFLSANLALQSSVMDEHVNVLLPVENSSTVVSSAPVGYNAASTSLSQTLGRVASCLAKPTLFLYTFIHHLGELQDWADSVPESLKRIHFSLNSLRMIDFLNLRWFDAVMVATKPFLASLARFGGSSLSSSLHKFFYFCANVATLAARETLLLMRHLEAQNLLKGLTGFEQHFLLQSAGVLALSTVVQMGRTDERLRYKECMEMLRRLPGGQHQKLIAEMQGVELQLERLAAAKETKRLEAANVFDSGGLPSLSVKSLLKEFVSTAPEQKAPSGVEDKDEDLARWIPRRVIWDDITACISIGVRREDFIG